MTQLKICVLGAFAVGKTSLVGRFTRGIFSDRYLATLGVKIDRKVVTCDGQQVKLILWDMAGEDEFAKVSMTYLRGAHGYLLVTDGTRRATLDQAIILERRVRDTVGAIPFVVLLNKHDLESYWEIGNAELAALTRRQWVVQRTSAKSGDGVDLAFEVLTRLVLQQRETRTGDAKPDQA